MLYIIFQSRPHLISIIILGFCRSAEEMELVLKQNAGVDAIHFLYPRLILAIDHKQKGFVSHPNTQQVKI